MATPKTVILQEKRIIEHKASVSYKRINQTGYYFGNIDVSVLIKHKKRETVCC